VAAPEDAWVHDLSATTSLAELWPLLLVLALLLWPLDVALRRVSIGRRELAAARAWIGGPGRRRRATAARTATSAGLLAARDRAGSAVRLALLEGRPGDDGAGPATPAAPQPAPAAAPSTPAPAARAATVAGAPGADDAAIPAPGTGDTGDTMERLRSAKRRARDR
jgi:hypothetical protein